MKAHPVANLFPLMEGEAFDALVADIRDNGQREAIVMLDGLILDGRNRSRACEQLGVKPRVVEWNGVGTPQAFVVSANLHRRHLSEVQRALIAEQLAKLQAGQRLNQAGPKEAATLTRAQAAELMNVGVTSVTRVRKILREGTPEEIADVKAGKVGLFAIDKRIRKRAPGKPKASKPKAGSLAKTGKNPDRIERMRVKAGLWAKLSAGLDGLTSLPLPADVAKIVGDNPNRRRAVSQKLSRAIQWLGEFEHEWKRRDENAA